MVSYKELDFVLVGPTKTGSTWLATCLREHPDIHAAHETNYLTRHGDGAGLDEAFDGARESGILGDYGATYATDRDVPGKLRTLNPTLSAIMTVRDPVRRAISAHRMDVTYGIVGRHIPLENLLDQPGFEKRYLEAGRYSMHAERFIDALGEENLFLMAAPDSPGSNSDRLGDLFEFLGCTRRAVPSSGRVLNERIQPLAPSLFWRSHYDDSDIRRWTSRLLRPINLLAGKLTGQAPPSEEAVERIRSYYEDHQERGRLETLIEERRIAANVDPEDWSL